MFLCVPSMICNVLCDVGPNMPGGKGMLTTNIETKRWLKKGIFTPRIFRVFWSTAILGISIFTVGWGMYPPSVTLVQSFSGHIHQLVEIGKKQFHSRWQTEPLSNH